MANFIQKTKVLKYIHDKGKRCKSSYILRLETKLLELIDNDIQKLRGRTTLDLENAEAGDLMTKAVLKNTKKSTAWKQEDQNGE